MSEHILFLTGKLAEPRLKRVLEGMQPTGFTWEVRDIGLSVAALMTAGMIRRRLRDLNGATRIIVPGLCRGDLEAVVRDVGIPVERGTDDLKDLPVYFGRVPKPPDLSRYEVKIFAEIVEAPQLSVERILERARQYGDDGADVIDLGCLPDTPFAHLEEAVAALKSAGFLVSVDSVDTEELMRGGRSGADFLLSLSESSLWVADEVDSVPVLIPEGQGGAESLYRAIDQMGARSRPFLADSILDPIHFGFTSSILRYAELRRRYPDIPIMMGTGNITELTEADTTGIHAVLFGIMSELQINNILTTQVSPHAILSVREADRARRIMHAARREETVPKGIDPGLLMVHERKPFPDTPEEVAELAAAIRDPSYRVQVTEAGIHVYNRDGMETGTDPFELFPRLKALAADAPHAFYMGVELAKARLAWTLGKRYVQDEELRWGVATPDAPATAVHAPHKPEGATLKASREKRTRKKSR